MSSAEAPAIFTTIPKHPSTAYHTMRGLRAANGLIRCHAATAAPPRSVVGPMARPAREKLTFPPHRRTLITALPNSAACMPTTPLSHPPPTRPFSHTAPTHKSKKRPHNDDVVDANPAPNHTHKHSSKHTAIHTPKHTSPPNQPPPSSSSTNPNPLHPDPTNPFDLTDLHTALARHEERFTSELKKLRSGTAARAADALGAIPVVPDKKDPHATFPLRELATVAPLGAGGRRWSILAFEEGTVKAIAAAVQRAEGFGQQPQRSEENPLELTLVVEGEKVDGVVKRVREVCQVWRERVREEVHKRGEVNKKWRAEGVVLSDDLFRLKGMVQKVQDERMRGILGREKEVVGAVMARGS